jgi:hypothetical protein
MAKLEEFECGMCGRDGGPVEGCKDCHGNTRFLQRRANTLSDLRSGRVKPGPRNPNPKRDDPTWQGTDKNA